jgi:predicted ATPase
MMHVQGLVYAVMNWSLDRFITLIDCVYDNAVRLVWSAETMPQHLFQPKGNKLSDSQRM